MSTSKSLFEPLTFRTGLVARNRVVLAPMTNRQSHPDGSLGEDELRWLCARADGGFGLILTCAAHVALDGQGWAGELGIFDDRQIPGLTQLAQQIKQRGAAALVQIFHGGVRADPAVSGQPTWSASPLEGAREATEEDILKVIDQFAAAAERAQRAGFDGVEIHGAHGYLLTQFLSSTQNQRQDRWGGDLPGRARLIREVTRAVRARTSPKFTVGVRLSPEDFGNARGMDLDESVQTAAYLAQDGADFVHVSLWRSADNTKKRPDQHALPLFRAALPQDVVLLCAGAIWTPAEATALLARGADGVALGRSAILNPDWPTRARDPGFEPRRPPMSPADLRERAVSPGFVEYLRNWKGFVT